jgi:hypothetical protein
MGNLHVRFLEGWAPAMAPGYSTAVLGPDLFDGQVVNALLYGVGLSETDSPRVFVSS